MAGARGDVSEVYARKPRRPAQSAHRWHNGVPKRVGRTRGNSKEYNVGGAHGFLGAGGTACRRGTCRNTQRSSVQKSAQEVRTKRRARELVWAVRAGVWETVAHAGLECYLGSTLAYLFEGTLFGAASREA